MGCAGALRRQASKTLHLERSCFKLQSSVSRDYTGCCSSASGIEVRVRTRGFLSFAALTLCAASTAFTQTPSSTPAPQSPPAPPSAPASQSAPVPTPAPSGTTESVPAYERQAQQQTAQQPTTPSAPIPEKKGPVVAPPATPTPQAPYLGYPPYAPAQLKPPSDRLGSVYIPVDSWMYPALTRLYSMGFLDTMYLSRPPYTRRSTLHMLLVAKESILNSENEEAQEIFAKLLNELSAEIPSGNVDRGLV